MKIHIQGDRNIATDSEKVKVLQLIAEELKRRGDIAILGAYGDVAKIVADIMGSQAVCYGHRPEEGRGQRPQEVQFVDCGELAAKIGYPNDRVVAWGIRQGLFLRQSDAFIYFAGAEGTLADLIPAITHCFKCSEKSKEKPLVLIGWSPEKLVALKTLYGGQSPSFIWVFAVVNEITVQCLVRSLHSVQRKE